GARRGDRDRRGAHPPRHERPVPVPCRAPVAGRPGTRVRRSTEVAPSPPPVGGGAHLAAPGAFTVALGADGARTGAPGGAGKGDRKRTPPGGAAVCGRTSSGGGLSPVL